MGGWNREQDADQRKRQQDQGQNDRSTDNKQRRQETTTRRIQRSRRGASRNDTQINGKDRIARGRERKSERRRINNGGGVNCIREGKWKPTKQYKQSQFF